jgi:hypothetical protein
VKNQLNSTISKNHADKNGSDKRVKQNWGDIHKQGVIVLIEFGYFEIKLTF